MKRKKLIIRQRTDGRIVIELYVIQLPLVRLKLNYTRVYYGIKITEMKLILFRQSQLHSGVFYSIMSTFIHIRSV